MEGIFSESLFQEMFQSMIEDYRVDGNSWEDQNGPLMVDICLNY
jgi:hypothetical protein